MSGGAIVSRKDQLKTVRHLLQRMQPQIAMAVPRGAEAERFTRMAMTVVQQNPKLLDCTQASLLGAIMTSAALGLYPDTSVLGHAYFVPFKNTVVFIPGYRGLIDLARRSGSVTSIMAYPVYEGDQFSFSYGLNPELTHVPSGEPTDERELTHVYAIARLKNEPIPQFIVMTKDEVDKIRARSRAKDKGPWVTDYEPMAMKTVIRRLCKYLPLSSDLQRAVSLDEHAEVGLDQGLDTVGDEVLEGLADPDEDPDIIEGEVEGEEEQSTLDDLTDSMPATEPDEFTKMWAKGNDRFGDEAWQKLMKELKKTCGVSRPEAASPEGREKLITAMAEAIEKGG